MPVAHWLITIGFILILSLTLGIKDAYKETKEVDNATHNRD